MFPGIIGVSLEVYLVFLAGLAILIAATLWGLHRRAMRARHAWLAAFDPEDLRMSPVKIGIVYKVLAQDGAKVTLTVIWDQGRPVKNGPVLTVVPDALIPFDGARFF